jgi:selenide, water dikinase
MGPGDLSDALAPLPRRTHPDLIVGRETFDDAGVFRLSDDLALVQTVDFFAPVVDDPYQYGQIAAANALSDVYAMGGEPMTALNIVGFPTGKLPISVLTDILRGGQDKVHEAGGLIVGGHTVVDDEVKYGLAVTGRVHPQRILTNAGARAGDVLVLTKPLGTGILTTAAKRGPLDAAVERNMIAVMSALNGDAARAAVAVGVTCATDVTGFGLLGHASHVARASAVSLRLVAAAVPVLPGAAAAWTAGGGPAGAGRNQRYLEALVDWGQASDVERALIVDPQTSGGLLVAVPPSRVAEYLARVPGAVAIGEVVDRAGAALHVA